MKITRKNLSADINKTLDKVDQLLDGGFNPSNIDSKEDINIHFDNVEISDICDITTKKSYIKHSVKDVITDSNEILGKFPTNKMELEVSNMYNLPGNYRLFKQINGMLVLLTEEGFLSVYKRSLNKPIFSINIVKEISENFNDIYIFDIDDIEIAGETILIATRRFGVFSMNNTGKVNNILITDSGISHIKHLGDNKLLCLYSTDISNNVKLFTVDKGKYIQGYNHLKKDTDQKPKDYHVETDLFAVLGSPKENEGYSRSLHVWKKGNLGTYSNVDGEIYPHTDDVNYHSKFIVADDNFIYIIGDYKNKTFIWKWRKRELHKKHTEEFIDVDCRYIDNVYIVDDILTLDGIKTLYRYNLTSNKIISNFRFETVKNIQAFYEQNGKYFIFNGDKLTTHLIPKQVNSNNKFNILLNILPFDNYKVVIKCATPELVKVNVPSMNFDNMKFFIADKREVTVNISNKSKPIELISIKGITKFDGGDLDE